MSIVSDSVDYGDDLNDGRSDMKPRKILEMPDNWIVGGKERDLSFQKMEKRFLNRIKDALNIYDDR